MQRFKNYFISLQILLVLSACSKTVYTSNWQSQLVNPDGIAHEWNVPLRFYDTDSKLQYSLTNDSVNLYLCIRATDEMSQLKIIRSGMQVWLDTTGRMEHHTGIMFPLVFNDRKNTGFAPDSLKGRNLRPGKIQGERSLKSIYELEPKQMQLLGFIPPVVGFTPLRSVYGISAELGWDNNDIMTYEAVIPLKTFYRSGINNIDCNRYISMSIVVPGISRPKGGGSYGGGNHQGGMGGGMHQGGGFQGSGGHHARNSEGETGRGTGNFEELGKNNTINIRFRLAANHN